MNIKITIACCFFVLFAKADLPFMPFQFELKTAKQTYEEGEKVEFILTVSNIDKERTWPLLMPGTQNAGLKLIYLEVYDIAGNLHLLRAKEDRMMNMLIKHPGVFVTHQLKPGEQIQYTFYWNDSSRNTDQQVASHHLLDVPLFTGAYKVRMCYNPQGTIAGDSLYHFLSNTEEEQSTTKVNFLTGGEAATCELRITKSTKIQLTVQQWELHVKHEREDGYFYYRKDDSTNYMHYIEAAPGDFKPSGRYYTYVKETTLAEFITRFETGAIRTYRRYRSECPTPILEREFNEVGVLIHKADRLPTGEVVSIHYHNNGTINTEERYTADAKQRKLITYIYHTDGRFKRKKTEVFDDPCIEYLLEGKDENN
ncbi:MAG: hypothetical protein U0T11_06175 [Chitinophagaceae bacterium]